MNKLKDFATGVTVGLTYGGVIMFFLVQLTN